MSLREIFQQLVGSRTAEEPPPVVPRVDLAWERERTCGHAEETLAFRCLSCRTLRCEECVAAREGGARVCRRCGSGAVEARE